MKIANDLAVSIHYTLTDDTGAELDSSRGSEPLVYLHGHHNLIAGLENALQGLVAGDKMQVVVPPEEGYGLHDASLVQAVPRDMFQGVDTIELGMEFHVQGPEGDHFVEVVKIEDDFITIDGNHGLAGKVLHFDVEVIEVREATQDELAHGHIHGPGECAH